MTVPEESDVATKPVTCEVSAREPTPADGAETALGGALWLSSWIAGSDCR